MLDQGSYECNEVFRVDLVLLDCNVINTFLPRDCSNHCSRRTSSNTIINHDVLSLTWVCSRGDGSLGEHRLINIYDPPLLSLHRSHLIEDVMYHLWCLTSCLLHLWFWCLDFLQAYLELLVNPIHLWWWYNLPWELSAEHLASILDSEAWPCYQCVLWDEELDMMLL